ncbi:hypothetical protein F751_1180 [Auxenochlorella protothecoides]|uniref:Uncharacterized protein n=1 Tax=Auxenochlorella protothecoides TaxID=3075 RepID=A0A087SNU9_AUXPR|nr:hypothetical protein F751_1180 [Auxenochlorella protothecoides]KFM27403.1 hypothetical protein F751_1180 [Auxenochlorella protothecoides]
MASPGSGPARDAGVHVPRDPGEAELAFDAGTYPLGICLADVSVVGVAQHSAFPTATVRVGAGGATEDGGAEGGGAAATTPAPSAPPPCFQPLPGSQPALHCLLHRQLAGGRGERALALARWYAAAPHFPRSAEWLLFTALEGVQKAAACLLVINHLEGPGTAQNLAVQVVREAVRSQRYALAAEAIRFLTPPGEEGLLQAVGLVGRQGAAGVAAARRASLAGAGGRGPDGTGTPGAGLAGWLWSWWGGAGEAGGAGTARVGEPSDAAPPTLERSSGAAPAPLRRHSSSRQVSASLETLDSLTPLVDVWDLLAGHARALVEDAAYARLAGFSAALRALPGTSLATLLGGTGGTWAALLQVAPVLRAALGAPGEGEGGGSEVGGAVTADGDGAPGAPGSR